MKINRTTSLVLFGLIIIIGIVLMATNNRSTVEITVEDPLVTSSEDVSHELMSGTYTIDSESSLVTWTARKKLIPSYVDKGTFTVADGSVVVDEEGAVTVGNAHVAINSIVVTETGVGGGFSGLARELVSDKFFDAETYPDASFIVTDIVVHRKDVEIMGDLTVKNVTQSVTLPVVIQQIDNDTINIIGMFDIDRTDYDITFGSDKFFDDLGDRVIDDMVSLEFSLRATRTVETLSE